MGWDILEIWLESYVEKVSILIFAPFATIKVHWQATLNFSNWGNNGSSSH